MALAHLNGATDEEIRQGMSTFQGVDRRFDFRIKDERHVLLSDYAHHPAEIAQSLQSIRELYQGRKITAIFQPHLYTRTRDFYQDFAESLSLADEVILTEIYPAREQPIPGVSNQLIFDRLKPGVEKHLCSKKDIQTFLTEKKESLDIVIILGAGDLESQTDAIGQILKS